MHDCRCEMAERRNHLLLKDKGANESGTEILGIQL